MTPKTVTNRSEAYHHFRGRGYSIGLASRMAADWTIESLWHRVKYAEAVFRYCEEYFDQRADAEYFPDSPAPHPNEEMKLLMEIRALLNPTNKESGG